MAAALLLIVAAPIFAANIQTDLWVYQDGDTVTVTGDGFGALEVVDFTATDPDGVVVDQGSASTDEAGNVTYQFVLRVTVGGIYTETAVGRTSGLTATVEFDPVNATYSPSRVPASGSQSVTAGSPFAFTWSVAADTGATVSRFKLSSIPGSTDIPSSWITVTAPGGANVPSSGTSTVYTFPSASAEDFSVTITPASGSSGDYGSKLKLVLGGAGEGSGTDIFLSVAGAVVNDAPVATDGAASVAEDDASGVSIDLGALVSDTETSDANLTYTIVSGPSASAGTLSGSGSSRTFTPAANYNGSASFTYKVTDRGDPDNCGTPSGSCAASLDSDTKTITITVNPLNDAPVASDGSASTSEDTPVVIDLGSFVSDVETSDANLTYTVVSGPSASAGSLSGTGASRTFTPTAGYNGSASFTYKVTDRGDPDNCGAVSASCTAALDSDTKTITISIGPVNSKPIADDGNANVAEDDASGVSIDLAALVSDAETSDANLTYTIVSGPAAAAGTLSGSGSSRTFTPAANYNGSASFTYKVTDRGDPDNCGAVSTTCAASLDSDTKTISITVTPVNDAPSASDGNASVAEDNAAGTSIDLAALASDLETTDANLTYTIVSGPAAAAGTLSGSGSSRTFTPAANYNGPASFTYKVTDRGDPDNCGAVSTTCAAPLDSETKTISITVTPVNDAPSASDDTTSVAEDDAAGLAIDLAALVSDLETTDANLTYTIVAAPNPATGVLSGTGSARTFTPFANYNGSASFTYKVTDRGDPDNCGAVSTTCAASLDSATKTISITVTPVNDTPSASDLLTSTNEDTATLIDLGALVSDIETADADLTYTIVSAPPVGEGSLSGTGSSRTFTPALNWNGTTSFTYKVTDRGDPDNCGAVSTTCDGSEDSATKTVTITVNAVNDAPVFVSVPSGSGVYSDAITPFTVTATDVEGSTLTFAATGLPSGLSINSATGEVSGTVADAAGSYTVTYSVSDGDATTNTTGTVTIAKEDATVGYTGNLGFAGSTSPVTVELKAVVTPSADGTPGDVTKAKVLFRLYKSTNLSMATPDATCLSGFANASGEATCSTSIAFDDWTVVALVDPANGYYTSPQSDPAVINVYQPVPDKFTTGGGWVIDPGYQSKPVAISSTNRKGNFGFNVKTSSNGKGLQGQSVYVFRGADGYNYVVKSNSWQGGSLSFGAGTDSVKGPYEKSTFTGKCNVTIINPVTGLAVSSLGGYTFRVDITDYGQPGVADTYALTVYTGGGAIYHQVGTNTSPITLGGGNVVVHGK